MADQDFVTLIERLLHDQLFSEKFHDPATRAAALSDLKITPNAALLNALSMVDYGIIETVRALFEPNTAVRPFN
jgi:hypothetical protein